MALIEINWHPNRKQLRGFGIAALVASVVISSLLYLVKGLTIHWSLGIFVIGLTIFISSILSLAITRAIYICLTAVTLPIGLAVSFILLAAFYFLLLAPLGLLFRVVGRDPLQRKFDSTADTYWLRHHPPENLDRYFQQF
jgi:hypothetical protein